MAQSAPTTTVTKRKPRTPPRLDPLTRAILAAAANDPIVDAWARAMKGATPPKSHKPKDGSHEGEPVT